LIIDEISMVGVDLLLQIHHILCDWNYRNIRWNISDSVWRFVSITSGFTTVYFQTASWSNFSTVC